MSTRKKEGIRLGLCRETGLNQILVRFLLAKSPTRGLNVLKFPFSEVTPYKRAAEPKELLIVPGASYVDLYDRVGLIPFDKLTSFFRKNLK